MNDAPPPLSIQNLSAGYPREDNEALQPLSFDLAPATLTAVIGPNGAGKSTLLKAALGFLKPKSGHALFFGQDLDDVRSKISYMPQRNETDPDFPILVRDVVLMGLYNQVSLFQRFKGEHIAQAMHALENVNMSDFANHPIGTLSGGQRQRVFLARALAQKAELYLMDEPFVGIDMTSFQIMSDVLKSLKAKGKTILIVHHDLYTARQLFDHALLINRRLIAYGPIEETLSPANIEVTYKSFHEAA